MRNEALDLLLEKYAKGACSEQEKALMDTLLDKYAKLHQGEYSEDEARNAEILHRIYQEIQQEIQKDNNNNNNNLTIVHGKDKGEVNEREGAKLILHQKTSFEPPFGEMGLEDPAKKNRITAVRKMRFWHYSAVAMICLGIGLYFLGRHGITDIENQIAFKPKNAFVTPGRTSASILLSDGKKVQLDSALSARISKIQVSDRGVFLLDKNGKEILLEKNISNRDRPHVFSSLITERGQQAPEMTLADGTKVWLNAASELRFPVHFSDSLREVQLTGEAYFEVAHDAIHPFIVHLEKSDIKVLGTHFNVMAYQDEDNISATLLEGAIQLTSGVHKVLLAAGQKGVVDAGGTIKIKKVNTKQAVAWMHGQLPMDNMEVHAFLREVSRWYDVDIQYLDAIPAQTFSGNLNRQVPLENILDALKVNGVNAYLENRTIVVSQ